MAKLIVKIRGREPEIFKTVNVLKVYDVAYRGPVDSAHDIGKATLTVGSVAYRGNLRVMGDPVFSDAMQPAKVHVKLAETNNHIKYIRNHVQVFNVAPGGSIIKPMDEDRIKTEPGEEIPVTNVELALSVSFDTYFDFYLNSLDGIKSVLDENGNKLTSDSDQYRLRDLVPGEGVNRTITTRNDFSLRLNIKPTMVKSKSS